MDCDTIETLFEELDGYNLPEEAAAKFDAVRMKFDNFDYDGILKLLGDNE